MFLNHLSRPLHLHPSADYLVGLLSRVISSINEDSLKARQWNNSDPLILAARHGWLAFLHSSAASSSLPARTYAYNAETSAFS